MFEEKRGAKKHATVDVYSLPLYHLNEGRLHTPGTSGSLSHLT